MKPDFRLRPVSEADFEPLLSLSIRVLRADLERLGRFKPELRRERFRAIFKPATLSAIEVAGECVGCIGAEPRADHLHIHAFYVQPVFQGCGLGAAVLARVTGQYARLPVRIEVLKGSAALGFWQRQGFGQSGEEDFDLLLERPAPLG
ncbi:MAG: GNAT family N-acetyltransferase [Roseomonas sp.]|nr:GNAT family N-acetyltransferase [Roseomonas sp.]MCA3316532.1 GNAT family N-acetyltransferase [Roseomonas sp.]MCA3321739.1 GNAT family N-acetyltransferase [Roseomonas sp.]